MKVLKVIGKIAKWYGILTVGIWASVGVSEVLRAQREINTKDSVNSLEILDNVFDRAERNYKDWWNWLKG